MCGADKILARRREVDPLDVRVTFMEADLEDEYAPVLGEARDCEVVPSAAVLGIPVVALVVTFEVLEKSEHRMVVAVGRAEEEAALTPSAKRGSAIIDNHWGSDGSSQTQNERM